MALGSLTPGNASNPLWRGYRKKRKQKNPKHIIKNLTLNDKPGTNIKRMDYGTFPVLLNHVKAWIYCDAYFN